MYFLLGLLLYYFSFLSPPPVSFYTVLAKFSTIEIDIYYPTPGEIYARACLPKGKYKHVYCSCIHRD